LSQRTAVLSIDDRIYLTAAVQPENVAQAVTVYPLNATNPSWAITVSDPDILEYENGRVIGLIPGEATVTFTAGDRNVLIVAQPHLTL